MQEIRNGFVSELTLTPAAAPPTTIVCATVAMYPSTWTPKSIFTTSPSFIVIPYIIQYIQ